MNKTRTAIPAILILAIAAGVGGWFWSSNYLLGEGETNVAPNKIAQTAPDGAHVPRIPRPKIVWKQPSPAELKAAKTSIISQLEAFKKDDWAKASTYQSAALKGNFGSIANFQQVIEKQYPQFADYQKIDFLQAQASGPHIQIAVKLTGRDGVKLDAVYMMVKENGIYRVAGVGGGMAPKAAEEPANLI